jgi:hypothetical protein
MTGQRRAGAQHAWVRSPGGEADVAVRPFIGAIALTLTP